MLRVQHRVVLHQVRRGRGLADVASAPTAASAEKRLHSTDIAFKPTEGGWGFNSTFATGYDRCVARRFPLLASAQSSRDVAVDRRVTLTLRATCHVIITGFSPKKTSPRLRSRQRRLRLRQWPLASRSRPSMLRFDSGPLRSSSTTKPPRARGNGRSDDRGAGLAYARACHAERRMHHALHSESHWGRKLESHG